MRGSFSQLHTECGLVPTEPFSFDAPKNNVEFSYLKRKRFSICVIKIYFRAFSEGYQLQDRNQHAVNLEPFQNNTERKNTKEIFLAWFYT